MKAKDLQKGSVIVVSSTPLEIQEVKEDRDVFGHPRISVVAMRVYGGALRIKEKYPEYFHLVFSPENKLTAWE